MSLSAVKILEINITKSSKKEILEYIQKYLKNSPENSRKNRKHTPKPLIIATPNPEQIVLAQSDSHVKKLLNQADVALPDGIGVIWANRMLSRNPSHADTGKIPATIPGVNFVRDLVELSEDWSVPIILIGGQRNVAVKAFECLQQKYPEVSGVAMEAPEFGFGPSGLSIKASDSEESLVRGISVKKGGKKEFETRVSTDGEYFAFVHQLIREWGACIVFVALGAPKQEYFIERVSNGYGAGIQEAEKALKETGNGQSRAPVIFMSVGGSFDEIAGLSAKAPLWMEANGLKWLWRLLTEPWRLKRQLSLVRFVALIVRDRFNLM